VAGNFAEATTSVLLGGLGVIPGMSVTINAGQAGTIYVSGNVNVFTDKDAFVYVYLDGEQIGPPFYTSVANAWSNVPVFAMRNVTAGQHTITLRGSANGSNARAGSRVVTVMGF
jgi:5-keto 4-deoxyuronate isomerase